MRAVIALVLATAAAAAGAVPIRYVIEGTGSGRFAGMFFSGEAYRLVLTADTDSWDGARLTIGEAVFEVDGMLPAVFVDPSALRYAGSRVSFEGWWFGEDALAFTATPPSFLAGFAPVAGTDVVATMWSQMTNRGLVELTSSSDVLFSAAVVPEPATWAQAALGLTLLSGCLATRRRDRATRRTHHRTASAPRG